jgi:hypothetical protein
MYAQMRHDRAHKIDDEANAEDVRVLVDCSDSQTEEKRQLASQLNYS